MTFLPFLLSIKGLYPVAIDPRLSGYDSTKFVQRHQVCWSHSRSENNLLHWRLRLSLNQTGVSWMWEDLQYLPKSQAGITGSKWNQSNDPTSKSELCKSLSFVENQSWIRAVFPTPASSILFVHFSASLGFPAWQVKIDSDRSCLKIIAGQVTDWSSLSSHTPTDLRVYNKQPE